MRGRRLHWAGFLQYLFRQRACIPWSDGTHFFEGHAPLSRDLTRNLNPELSLSSPPRAAPNCETAAPHNNPKKTQTKTSAFRCPAGSSHNHSALPFQPYRSGSGGILSESTSAQHGVHSGIRLGPLRSGLLWGDINTPNLDALAANGLRFTQFYNTHRRWPSWAARFTGYYTQQVNRDSLLGAGLGLYPEPIPPQLQRENKGILPAWAHLLPSLLAPQRNRSYHSGKRDLALKAWPEARTDASSGNINRGRQSTSLKTTKPASAQAARAKTSTI